MRDGRVFQGTPLQIVQAMQAIAFGVEQLSVDRYIDWVVDNAQRFERVELKVPAGAPEERAAVLVEEMVAKGLASR
ncbi:MAG: hypothetical protein IT374_27900 [Polyangiaceae bacterium]|nr:hypothetical protein [Polyangiaceae bacterium]